MKKLIPILFLISAVGCSKSADRSKFAGSWSGSYSTTIIATHPPTFDTGTVHITVGADNSATGTMQSLHGGVPSMMKGAVDPSTGIISLSQYGDGDYGISVFLVGLNGNLSIDTGSGTLAFPWATTSKWRATKN